MELFRDRGAAHHLAALDDFHPQARHREIGRASEAVMPGADDDNVRFVHARFRCRSVIPGRSEGIEPGISNSGSGASTIPE